jgi:hypothetical protein
LTNLVPFSFSVRCIIVFKQVYDVSGFVDKLDIEAVFLHKIHCIRKINYVNNFVDGLWIRFVILCKAFIGGTKGCGYE